VARIFLVLAVFGTILFTAAVFWFPRLSRANDAVPEAC